MIILRRQKKVKYYPCVDVKNLPERICTLEDLQEVMYGFMDKYYYIEVDASNGEEWIGISHKSPTLNKRFEQAKEYVKEHKILALNIWYKEDH